MANQTWVYKGNQFCNRPMKPWVQDNHVEIYSTHNEENSVVPDSTRTFRNKIYKYMTSVSKKVFIDKLS